MNTAQGAQTDAGQTLRHAASQVSTAMSELMNTALGEETLATPIPGAAQAGKLDATAGQARLDATAQPQTTSLGGEAAGEFAGLSFRGGPLRNLPSQAYLRSQIFHSTLDGHAAGRELIKALRDALEPDAAQPSRNGASSKPCATGCCPAAACSKTICCGNSPMARRKRWRLTRAGWAACWPNIPAWSGSVRRWAVLRKP